MSLARSVDYIGSAKLLGADVTFRKPVEIEKLLATLRKLSAGR